MKWYLKVMKDFGNFRGRSRRSEYWYFVLFYVIFLIVAMVLDNIFGTTFSFDSEFGYTALPYGWFYVATALVHLIPGLAVVVRRLHDVGKSGWFYLIIFIPLIGAIWILVLMFTDSQYGDNKWGPNPKTVPLVEGDQLTIH